MQRQMRQNLQAAAVGVAAAIGCTVLYLFGGFEWLENKTLDLRFKYTNSIPQSPDIVCIDINDGSLEEVGRWPWPRDIQADIILVLGELEARAVLVDLEWNEPQARRDRDDPDTDLIDAPEARVGPRAELAYPDLELQAAVGKAGNVYVAYSPRPVALESAPEFQAAVAAYAAGDNGRADQAIHDLQARRARTVRARDITDTHIAERAQLVARLQQKPSETRAALAADQRLNIDVIADGELERARVAACMRIARQWLDADPRRQTLFAFDLFPQLFAQEAGGYVRDRNELRHAWTLAFRAAIGLESTLRDPILPQAQAAPAAMTIEGIVPTYYLIARAAKRRGFVTFDPDSDGVVRRLPLLRSHGDAVLSQIAFTLGFDLLGLTADSVSVSRNQIVLHPRNQDEMVIQLDEQGRAVVPWIPQGDWMSQFSHVSTQRLWRIGVNRQLWESNRFAASQALEKLLLNPEFARWKDARELIAAERDLLLQIRARRFARQFDLIRDLDEQLNEVRNELDRMIGEILSAAPERADDAVSAALVTLRRVRAAQPEMDKAIRKQMTDLKPSVRGKLCLIGYTATSLADIKPIPTNPSAPGVAAHANLLNGLMTGRVVRWTTPWVNAALALALGAMAAFLSAALRPGPAALALLGVLVPFVSIVAAAFYYWTFWIGLVPPAAAVLAAFLAVTIYRFVFLDREQRQLATALSQYTSKQIAKQMAENPELCKIAELRDVSAMFTDLRGFTSISELIGAQRTQKLLNVCLQQFTEVMLRHEGMVNKFLGDGVFAFWNPVIYPQPHHATQACRSALELQIALENLKDHQKASGGDEAFASLSLRVGIASGPAIVGPCGSEQKYDYTCIGDTVNLASRLESANKFFGTGILVNEGVHQAVGADFEFRSLGGVVVKGKQQAVQVYELLGVRDATPAEQLAYARKFEAAVATFQRRAWQAATSGFEACLSTKPDDSAAAHYLALCRQYLESPPPAEWNGGVELSEK